MPPPEQARFDVREKWGISNMRTILAALATLAVVVTGLPLFASPADAITGGPGLVNYANPYRGNCFAGGSPERTIQVCDALLSGSSRGIQAEKVYLALARAYSALHRTQAAMDAYDNVVEYEPGNVEALAGGCWIRGLLNIELDRALSQCQRALRLDPGDAQIVEDRCLVYFRMGNYAKADADCSGAATFPPTASRALFIRGLAKLKKGDSAGGNADITAAKQLKVDIASDFAADGLAP